MNFLECSDGKGKQCGADPIWTLYLIDCGKAQNTATFEILPTFEIDRLLGWGTGCFPIFSRHPRKPRTRTSLVHTTAELRSVATQYESGIPTGRDSKTIQSLALAMHFQVDF